MFDRFAAVLVPTAEPVLIPFKGTTLPGNTLLRDGRGKPRPWLIMNNGSDGAMGDMWVQGAAGLQRAPLRRLGQSPQLFGGLTGGKN